MSDGLRRIDARTWIYNETIDEHHVGGCAFYLADGYVVIQSLKVPEDVRQRGFGRRILNNALKILTAAHPEKDIYIAALPYGTTCTTQEQLIRFYESEGFVRSPNHPYELVIKRKNTK